MSEEAASWPAAASARRSRAMSPRAGIPASQAFPSASNMTSSRRSSGRFKVTGENAQGKLVGKHLSTGVGQPAFWERAQSYNREVELQGALTSMDEDLS